MDLPRVCTYAPERKGQRAAEPRIVCSGSRNRLVANSFRACKQPSVRLTDGRDALPQSWESGTVGPAAGHAAACRPLRQRASRSSAVMLPDSDAEAASSGPTRTTAALGIARPSDSANDADGRAFAVRLGTLSRSGSWTDTFLLCALRMDGLLASSEAAQQQGFACESALPRVRGDPEHRLRATGRTTCQVDCSDRVRRVTTEMTDRQPSTAGHR